MQRHWREVAPPANLLIAAYVGYKPKTPARRVEDMNEREFDADMQELHSFFEGL
jgi:hypothetical protein